MYIMMRRPAVSSVVIFVFPIRFVSLSTELFRELLTIYKSPLL